MREHGTHACYVHGPDPGSRPGGCRCEPCREAATSRQREARRQVAPPYVSATSVRAHIALLREHGMGPKTIAKRAGVPHGAVSKIVYGDYKGRGPSKRVRRETRDKILAVMPSDAADGTKIAAGPTWENVDKLLERGWTKVGVARAIGQSERYCVQLGKEYVTAGNARAIAALIGQPVPPRRSRHGLHPVPQPDPENGPAYPAGVMRLPELGDLSWRDRSACRLPNVPSWIFFPDGDDPETTEAALKVCRSCPVKADCLAAHVGEPIGIFGGATENERREMRRQLGIAHPDEILAPVEVASVKAP